MYAIRSYYAFSLAKETGERFYVAELYRLQGELLLADSEPEAEACFQEALRISREQDARSLELRAATSLAGLWTSQDKATQARQMLLEIYECRITSYNVCYTKLLRRG